MKEQYAYVGAYIQGCAERRLNPESPKSSQSYILFIQRVYYVHHAVSFT